jgi:tripartite-type tricarboxylate transporter receptor subunit TctC
MKTNSRIVLALVLAASAGYLQAQPYPSKPVRLLVGYPPGGGMDAIARVLAQKVSEDLGQQMVVENRAGASGAIAADAAAKSAPDGYSLYLGESGYLILSTLSSNLTTDPVKSFAPVTAVGSLPLVFAVPQDFPAQNVRELIAVIKASPGKYSYGSPGVGTIHHLAFELFKRAAGLDVVHVPYKGGTPIIPDLITGRIAVGVLSSSLAAGPVKSGKVRPIALTSPQRVAFAPDWPPLAETLPGFDASPNIFLLAPAGTPGAVVAHLNEATRKILALAEVQQSFANQGATPATGSADELRSQIIAEIRRWGAIAKEVGLRAE